MEGDRGVEGEVMAVDFRKYDYLPPTCEPLVECGMVDFRKTRLDAIKRWKAEHGAIPEGMDFILDYEMGEITKLIPHIKEVMTRRDLTGGK